nr:PKD domain-containing protein [uncultured Desulfobulbus sp.]
MKRFILPRYEIRAQMVFWGTLLIATSASAVDFSGSLKEVTITDVLNANSPPVAQLSTAVDGKTVTFDASGSTDTDGTIEKYVWDFGDGSSAEGVSSTHQFLSSSATVTLTVTDNNGGVAIKQVALSLYTESFDVIVDDADAANFSTVGTWGDSTFHPDYYGTGYKFTDKGDGASQATWSFSVPVAGNYTLYSHMSATGSSRSSKAPFVIMNNTTSLGAVYINQQTGSGEFVTLGTYPLEAGEVKVTLSSAPDGYVIADAVKLTYNP